MRPIRPPSDARRITRGDGRNRNLERRLGGATTTTDWVEFDEPYANDWEWPGGDAIKPAYKENPNPGKHPFLRGSLTGGVSGTSPFTVPGGPFDGIDVKVSAFTDGSNIAITTTDPVGVITIFTFSGATQEDLDDLTDALAAHLADTSAAHAASAISITDTGGHFTATDVEAALAELFTLISGLVPTSRTITAGSGLTGGGDLSANRTLDVSVDGATIEVSADTLRVKDGGITSAKIADGTITTGDLAFDPATQTELDAHTGDTTDAHDASAISVGPFGTIAATDVQAALEEIVAEMPSGGGSGEPFLYIEAGDWYPSASGGASGPNVAAVGGVTGKTIDFADGSDLTAEASKRMPDGWDGGDLTYDVDWAAAGAGTDGVVFGLEAQQAGDDEALPGFGSQVTVSDAHTATANKLLRTSESDPVTPDGTALGGNRLFLRLQRKASAGGDALAQTVKVWGVKVGYTVGDPPPTMPSLFAAGAEAESAASPPSIDVPYPTGLANNDVLFAQIYSRNTISTIGSPPAGWTLLFGPDTGGSTFRQWIYYKFSDGTETGTETWSISGAALFMGKMYAARGVALSSFTESGGLDQATGTAVTCPSITTTGPNRLAIAFVAAADDNTVPDFTGETGGDYTTPFTDYSTATGSDGMMGVRIAEIPAAGTLSGAGATMSASDPWLVRAFALKPL